jgi:hypothetical protein
MSRERIPTPLRSANSQSLKRGVGTSIGGGNNTARSGVAVAAMEVFVGVSVFVGVGVRVGVGVCVNVPASVGTGVAVDSGGIISVGTGQLGLVTNGAS